MAVVPATTGGTASMSTTAAAVYAAVGTGSVDPTPTDSPLASTAAQSAQQSDVFGYMSDIIYVNADNIATVFDTPPTQSTAAPSVTDKYPPANAPHTPKEPLSKGSIVAIGFGAAFGAILVAGIILASIYNRAQRKREENEDHDVESGNPDMDGKALGADEDDTAADKDGPARDSDEDDTGTADKDGPARGADDKVEDGNGAAPVEPTNAGDHASDSTAGRDPYAALGDTNLPTAMVDNGEYQNNLEVNGQPACADPYAALGNTNLPADIVANDSYQNNLEVNQPPCADAYTSLADANLPASMVQAWDNTLDIEAPAAVLARPAPCQWAPLEPNSEDKISDASRAPTANTASVSATKTASSATSAEAAVPNTPTTLGIAFKRAEKLTVIRTIADLPTVLQRAASATTPAPIADIPATSSLNTNTEVKVPAPKVPPTLGVTLQRAAKMKIIGNISELADVLEHVATSIPDLEDDENTPAAPLSAGPTEVGTPEITHSLLTAPSSTNLRTPRTASPTGSTKSSLDDSFRTWRFPLSPAPPSEAPPETPAIDSGHPIPTAGHSAVAAPAPDEGVDMVAGGGALKRRGAIRIFSRRRLPTADGGATNPPSSP